MSILVIAEHDNASLKGATPNTVTAALACGGEVHVLVAGHNAAGAAQAATQVAGVAKVLHADSAALAHNLAENVAAQVLDGPADAAGHVQLRRHNLARLPHLQVVGRVTRVHRRTA
ncbi:MAG: hypothetical protein RL509_1931, partial [Pseudomonadota bacterium]